MLKPNTVILIDREAQMLYSFPVLGKFVITSVEEEGNRIYAKHQDPEQASLWGEVEILPKSIIEFIPRT